MRGECHGAVMLAAIEDERVGDRFSHCALQQEAGLIKHQQPKAAFPAGGVEERLLGDRGEQAVDGLAEQFHRLFAGILVLGGQLQSVGAQHHHGGVHGKWWQFGGEQRAGVGALGPEPQLSRQCRQCLRVGAGGDRGGAGRGAQ